MSKKTKWAVMGSTERINISGFKPLLPLYRKAINDINETENLRVFNQLAAREGVECVDEFIERVNNDSEYRNEVLTKYKIG